MSIFRKHFIKPPNLQDLSKGQAGERWVVFLYEKKGFRILDTNFKAFGSKQLGELDIVCVKNRDLVAVEVKTRSDERFMQVEESINAKKQRLLKRMIHVFVQNNPRFHGYNLRVDVAVVLIDPVDNRIKSARILENVIEDE